MGLRCVPGGVFGLFSFLGVVLSTQSSCVGSSSTPCGSTVCAESHSCHDVHGCVTGAQLAACEAEADGTPCELEGRTDYHCDQGVCIQGTCGDGVVDDGEACDDGPSNSDTVADACRTDCTPARCGDGATDSAEICDDGNRIPGDGCAADCGSDESCGNGIVDVPAGESCDDGNRIPGDGCSTNCVSERCGNGVVEDEEVCDDGNTTGGDGCSSDCRSDERCGNGYVDSLAGELCDCGDGAGATPPGCADANGVSPSSCTTGCSITTCGDGYVGGAEECDGANLNGLDCSTLGLGFLAGGLSCGPDCLFDVSQCWACGNGTCEANAGETPQNCAADCEAIQIVAGAQHACALQADGSVRCWGYNASGQLGDGTATNRLSPTVVSGLADVTALAAGDNHTCALLHSGSVMCWGYNLVGQLGNGSIMESSAPVLVVGLSSVTAIAAGSSHTLAVISNGEIYSWGSNTYGQLGDNTTTSRSLPGVVSGISTAAHVAAGTNHSCAITGAGAAYCWGDNWPSGQLGDGTQAGKHVPTAVVGLPPVAQMAGGHEHTCARTTAGQLYCWGRNLSGQVGNGSSSASWVPVLIGGVGTVVHLSAGIDHTCAVSSAGNIYCWGWGGVGQLGIGNEGTRNTPQQVSSLPSSQQVAAGIDFTCALTASQEVHCWGSNYRGQLGDGTGNGIPLPVKALWFGGTLCELEFAVDANYRGCVTSRPFVDYSGFATLAGSSDDGHWYVGTATNFEMFGSLHQQASIQSNGTLTFTDAEASFNSSGACLPAATGAGDMMIAALWDDLDPSNGGTQGVYYLIRGGNTDRRFVAQWVAEHYSTGSTNPVQFQVVLHGDTDDIELRYANVNFGDPAFDFGASATVGIQAGPAGPALLYSCNQATVTDGLSITFFRK